MNLEKNYTVNPFTMGLLPMDSPNGDLWTIVIETTQIVIVTKKPIEIIDYSCHCFGTSYAGGMSSASAVMGHTQMLPICISGELGMYMFPHASSKRRDTLWLSHTHIKDWHQKDKLTTTVQFTNYQVMDLPVAKIVLERKAYMTAQYRHRISETVGDYKVSREQINRNQIADLNELIKKTATGTYQLQHVLQEV